MATATTERPKLRTRHGQKLKWFVPRWSTARELKKLAPTIFAVGPIVRIVGVSVIVGAAICVCAKIAMPQLQLDFIWKSLFAIPAMFAYVGGWFLIRLAVPGQVKLTEKFILHSAGQSGWRVDLKDIESAKLIIYSPTHIRLIFRAKGRVRKLAVPPSADLQLLVSLLSTTVVFDQRARFAAVRARIETARSSVQGGGRPIAS